jgi:hypothetical protein
MQTNIARIDASQVSKMNPRGQAWWAGPVGNP